MDAKNRLINTDTLALEIQIGRLGSEPTHLPVWHGFLELSQHSFEAVHLLLVLEDVPYHR